MEPDDDICSCVDRVPAALWKAGSDKEKQARGTLPSEAFALRISSRCTGSAVGLAGAIVEEEDENGNLRKRKSDDPAAWEGFCSCCKRPLLLELLPASVRPAKRNKLEEGDRCAYVIALWGSKPEYLLGAMVLAWSLRQTSTCHELVVLHTSDVRQNAVALLAQSGWTPHEVEYIKAAANLSHEGCARSRFAEVFTKLHVLNLVQYTKVLMLDIDLLVRENIDHLFELEAPAALVRGPEVGYKHGDKVQGKYFFGGARPEQPEHGWGQSNGINAGVMLLQPDSQVFKQCIAEVGDICHPEHIRGNGPEQDYLSRFFAAEWRHLSVGYNFQLHQMYFALNPGRPNPDRREFLIDPDLVKVIHYSSEPKPWVRFLDSAYASLNDDDWNKKICESFLGYRAWVLYDYDALQRECAHSGLVVGLDKRAYHVAWDKVHERSKGNVVPAVAAEDRHRTGSDCAEAIPDLSNTPPPNIIASGEQVTNKLHEDVRLSEDGWPLGEEALPREEAIQGAAKMVAVSQRLWGEAYRSLEAELKSSSLAKTVQDATNLVPTPLESEDFKKGSVNDIISSDITGWKSSNGWWLQGPLHGRFVASCGILPRPYALFIAGGNVLLDVSCEGIHIAAMSSPCDQCPALHAFNGSEQAIQAREWADKVPKGAIVMLAVVGLGAAMQANGVLEALAAAGLGCPWAMPQPACRVAAAVGQKGAKRWFATQASIDIAMASTHAYYCSPVSNNPGTAS